MKDINQSDVNSEQNGVEESTKGFPVVTEQDEVDAASFEVRKRNKDGSWTAATPVNVTNYTVSAQSAQNESAEETSVEEQAPAQEEAPVQKEPVAEDVKSEEPTAGWVDIPAPAKEEEEEPDAMEPASVDDKDKSTRKPHRRSKRIAAVAAGAAAVVVIAFSVFVYTYDSIFPGVWVADEYKLSGMTQEEAQAYIASDVQEDVLSQSVTLTGTDLVTDTDKEYIIQIADVVESLDSEASAEQAYLIGREGNYFQRVGTVLNCLFTGWNVSLNATLKDGAVAEQVEDIASDLTYDPVQPSWEVDMETAELQIDTGKQGLSFDEETVVSDLTAKMESIDFEPYEIETYVVDQDKPDAEEIAEDVNCDAQNATVDKTDGETVIEAVDGVYVEASEISSVLGDASEQSYTVPVELTEAEITKADLEAVLFRDVLATTTTYYDSTQTARTTNVRLAATACDGVILNPGEEFSYNDIVGERTAARGYQVATIFQEGEAVDGLGGGVCQPSSTIYMAVLRADLEVTERYCHQFQVSYTPISQDATVAWGSKDFKFVNNTDYPIKLDISMSGGALTVTIIGTKTDDKTVSLYTNTYVSGNYKYATLYKTVTVNGESTTTKENSSAYLLN